MANTIDTIKEYLKENLTIQSSVLSDLYGNNPDQMTITLLLEGEVISSTVMNPLGMNGEPLKGSN